MVDQAIAERIAVLVHDGFDTFYGEFKRLTRNARQWFDDRDWARTHAESQRRMDLYQRFVGLTLTALKPLTDTHPQDEALWRAVHVHYARVTAERIDVEVAETFFNAITRKIFHTVGVKPEIEFLDRKFDLCWGRHLPGLYRRFSTTSDLGLLFRQVLGHPRPVLEFADLDADVAYLARRFEDAMTKQWGDVGFDHVDMLGMVFSRVREAYLVGRLRRSQWYWPLIIPVQSSERGAVVDGAIFTVEETHQVFSSTRDYLFVDVDKPSDLVRFLSTLMPELTPSELYIGIAHHRHGKSLMFRELRDHLEKSSHKFVVAPGIKGLVMTVFTMPAYRNVFKIIRDRFDKPGASREGILRSYREVFRARRVGRLADTQEFEHLAFDRERFTDTCLKELLDKAANTVAVVGDDVVVSHLYIEEKMTPLNIYMNEAPIDAAARAVVDYGYAIKELAANNVFAGDLLWKNFGVTRFGHLVLYDYDEICPVTSCEFRRLPQARTFEEEMDPHRVYAAHDNEVFPEEWAPFIVPRRHPRLAEAFLQHHRDLCTPEFWNAKQSEVRAGELHIGLPYTPRYPDLQYG